MANKKFWSIDNSSLKYASKPGTPRSSGIISKKITPNGTIIEGTVEEPLRAYPYTPIQEYNYYGNSDISEKVPFVPSSVIPNAVIYPLGGNLRRYLLSDFLSGLNNIKTDSLDEINYGNNPYGTAIGSHWEGSFSVGSSPRNGNLIDNGISVTDNKLSIFNVFDRKEYSLNNSSPSSSSWSRTFSVTSETDYCLSFYIKSDTPATVNTTVNGVSISVSIPDTYKRIVIPYKTMATATTLDTTLTFTSSNRCTVSICGICFSEGKVPVEIDYRTDGKNRPLVFKPGILHSNKWTVKYTRYLPYRGNASNQFTDFVGGCEIRYPKENADDYEIVTVVCNGSTYTTYIRKMDGSVEKSDNPTVLQNKYISVGGDGNIEILLGGHMDGDNFVPTPGIYRDLMVFYTVLPPEDIESIDNSLMSLTYTDNNTDNNKYYIRSSLFKETL